MPYQISSIVRKIRVENKDTMAELAEKLKVSPTIVSMVERNMALPPSSWENMLNNIYDLTAERKKELKKAFENDRKVIKGKRISS